MTLKENRGMFYKALTTLENCADVFIKNDKGVLVEMGMCLTDDVFFTHVLDKGTIRLYKKDSVVVEFGSDDVILSAFNELLEQMKDI